MGPKCGSWRLWILTIKRWLKGADIFLGQWVAYHVGFGSVCNTVCDVGRGCRRSLTDNPGQFSGEKEIKAAKNK